jgi:hypothetical protein
VDVDEVRCTFIVRACACPPTISSSCIIRSLPILRTDTPRFRPEETRLDLGPGYRHTPVMQIGADIYCDSQYIIRELQRRFPEPTLSAAGIHRRP